MKWRGGEETWEPYEMAETEALDEHERLHGQSGYILQGPAPGIPALAGPRNGSAKPRQAKVTVSGTCRRIETNTWQN